MIYNQPLVTWCPQSFDKLLKNFIENTAIPAVEIRNAINYVVFSGGKRLRPQLVYLTGQLLSINPEDLHPIAIAIELTHTYSLVHDDLPAMDNDDLRRGRPTCHKAFSESCAILTGDALQAMAIMALTQGFDVTTTAQQKILLIQQLLVASGVSGMISGQQFDLSLMHQDSPVTHEQLEKIHYLKTSAMIQACVDMVWTLQQGHNQSMHHALQNFTLNFGLAYQMQDDYLDYYEPQSVGKSKSSDQANHKQTFSTLYSQQELTDIIIQTFNKAETSLQPFGNKATPLKLWMKSLQRLKQLNN